MGRSLRSGMDASIVTLHASVRKVVTMRWWIGLCVGLLLCTVSLSYPDERRGSPFEPNDRWEGYRTYRPERQRGWREQDLPDRFTIDKPGKCEVICERVGRQYRCCEYRC
jgi:hypothetical protein